MPYLLVVRHSLFQAINPIKTISILAIVLALLLNSVTIKAADNSAESKRTAQGWPHNHKVAISLSYDDALNSQLDHAIPALNKRNFKASFYVVPLSNAFQARLTEWRTIAAQGHELGNHSLFHACRSDKPNRNWVKAHNALEKKPMQAMLNEIKVANTLLQAIDGQTQRTFTPPCFDQQAQDGNYINVIKDEFIAIKSLEDKKFAALIVPNGIKATDIIEFIEQQPASIKLVNVLFHGIGGEHLSVTQQTHEALLDHLHANQDKYWVDTYRNIMLKKQKGH
ncbi:polysaccharide deacetylase family protein [Algibacillus agarilyticus]|uniref:polysaccharide deacetylase family protein n=1 Tax=Algibacillus agarilyticus TaxID=2234133 RepID=UPI000DD048DB|nr:polysaccharide deacetylase family protein [Algibacillus agarilyticus]